MAPLLFLAQNEPFRLANNGQTGTRAFADARFPTLVDAPQRFGSKSYGRFDGGNSTLSIRFPAVEVGASTAAQSWGPGREYPLILSGNAGGFPHAFIGTGKPLNLGILHLHTRLISGVLSQSAYSPIDTGERRRWASAGVVTIIPRGARGLEFGLIRFVQGALTHKLPTWGQARRVVQGAAVDNFDNVLSENQLASVFFRWAFPGSGFELYGEYGREDYSIDKRRLIQYPDDLRSYAFGFQRVFHAEARRMKVLRFELVNAELSASNRGERGDVNTKVLYQPFPPYLHTVARQGHTNNGLLLGSPEAYGGAGWRLGLDQFNEKGRTSFIVERNLRLDWLPATVTVGREIHPDVVWAIGGEALRFKGNREFGLSVTSMLNLNRNIERGHDVFNLRTALTVRGW
jgi:hypothetical protein